jgi:hypothetical protein
LLSGRNQQKIVVGKWFSMTRKLQEWLSRPGGSATELMHEGFLVEIEAIAWVP